MKKSIALAVTLILTLALTACGGADSPESVREDMSGSGTETNELIEQEAADTEGLDTSDDSADAEEDSKEESSDGSDSALLSPEFKKTMDDYEAWFDHYCEVMKKYQDNPSDIELLSEMTDLITEESKMLEQMENMDESEMNTAELAYYIEVTARIEKKLLEVADY